MTLVPCTHFIKTLHLLIVPVSFCWTWYRLYSASKLYYIGFSQGTAQAFAAFSSNPDLLAKVHLFVALSPAVRANHLSKSLLLSLVQANLRCVIGSSGCCCLLERGFIQAAWFPLTVAYTFWHSTHSDVPGCLNTKYPDQRYFQNFR